MRGKVISINISGRKGTSKKNIKHATLITNFGIKGDAHAGDWHRQISLLANESIEEMKTKGLAVNPGDFAENITTQFVALNNVKIHDKIIIGGAELEVTQIGKVCHQKCSIYNQAGDCIMPREGIFARVVKGDHINVGDDIIIIQQDKSYNINEPTR